MKLRSTLFLSLVAISFASAQAPFLQHRRKAFSQAAATSLLTNLVAYYKLDEASGDLTDIHGGKTMTLPGGALSSVAGVINTARSSSAGNPYGSRADDTSFEPGSQRFFICMWAKPSTLTQAGHPTLFGKWTESGNQREWGVWMVNGGQADIIVSGNGSTFTEKVVTCFTDTTTAKFIAAGWDGTNIMISINGGAFATEPFAGPVFIGTSNINMFARNNTVSSPAFQGMLDEIPVWIGRCLTITEVQGIWNGGAGKPFSAY